MEGQTTQSKMTDAGAGAEATPHSAAQWTRTRFLAAALRKRAARRATAPMADVSAAVATHFFEGSGAADPFQFPPISDALLRAAARAEWGKPRVHSKAGSGEVLLSAGEDMKYGSCDDAEGLSNALARERLSLPWLTGSGSGSPRRMGGRLYLSALATAEEATPRDLLCHDGIESTSNDTSTSNTRGTTQENHDSEPDRWIRLVLSLLSPSEIPADPVKEATPSSSCGNEDVHRAAGEEAHVCLPFYPLSGDTPVSSSSTLTLSCRYELILSMVPPQSRSTVLELDGNLDSANSSPVNAHGERKTLPPMLPSPSSLRSLRLRAALVLAASRMAAREREFLAELHTVVQRLSEQLQSPSTEGQQQQPPLPSPHERATDDSDTTSPKLPSTTANPEAACTPLHLSVPVYRVFVGVADTAQTRLASLCPLTTTLIADCLGTWEAVIGSAIDEDGECSSESTEETVGMHGRFARPWRSTFVLQILTALSRWQQKRCRRPSCGDTVSPTPPLFTAAEAAIMRTVLLQLWTLTVDAKGISEKINATIASHRPISSIAEGAAHITDSMRTLLHESPDTWVMRPSPSVLVHCLQGVSRSASVVLMYLIASLRHHLRLGRRAIAAKRQSAEDAAAVVNEERGKDSEMIDFVDLVDAVRRARPVVRPNLCFSMEMRAQWRRLMDARESSRARDENDSSTQETSWDD